MEQQALFERLNKSFQTGIRGAKIKKVKAYLEKKKLDLFSTGIGYSSGQFHHRKPEEFKQELFSIGYLVMSDVKTNNASQAYKSFGHSSLIFPMKDAMENVVSFYSYKMDESASAYLNEKGVYPKYPSLKTERLILTQNIFSAATILSSDELGNREAVLALRDGKLTPEIETIIEGLPNLNEIILLEE
jgi:hypothetical protein